LHKHITNPFLIMVINMTIVFAVLYILGWIIRLIRFVDPTKEKPKAPAAIAPKKVAAPAAAPAAVAAQTEDDVEIAAVIAAALAACGYHSSQIASIKKLTSGQSWTNAARIGAVNSRNHMF